MKRIFIAIICIIVALLSTSCGSNDGKSTIGKTVYTVTAEQWTASMAEGAFKNCEVIWWQGTVEEYNGGKYLSTPAYLSYGDAWFTLKEDPDGSTGIEYRKDGYDWSSDEMSEFASETFVGYADFAYNEETKRYESVTTEDETTTTRCAGFENGRLTYVYCMLEMTDEEGKYSRGWELKISNYGKVKVTPPLDDAKKVYEAATTDEMIASMNFEGDVDFNLNEKFAEYTIDDAEVILIQNGSVVRIHFSPAGEENKNDFTVRLRDGRIYRASSPDFRLDIAYEAE